MTKKARYNSPAFKDFKRYSNNSMSERERNAFEKEMEKDPFLKDAFEGFESLQETFFENDLHILKNQISQKTKKSNRITYYRIAASISLLLVLTTFIYLYINPKLSEKANSTILTESIESKDVKAADQNTIAEPAMESELIKPKQNKPRSEAKTKKTEVTPPSVSKSDMQNIKTENTEYEELLVEQDKETIPEILFDTKSAEILAEKSTPTNVFPRAKIDQSENYKEQKRLRGKVLSSEDYQPLAGATVSVKGSQNVTVTNMEGNFELPAEVISDTAPTLQIDYIGMERQEILADAGNDLNIVLNPSAISLNEIEISKASRRKSSAKDESSALAIKEALTPLGKKDFEKFILENQLFPKNNDGLKSAKIVLNFNINEHNQPINIKILESPSKIYSNEAIRLLQLYPKWIYSPDDLSTVKTTIILTSE